MGVIVLFWFQFDRIRSSKSFKLTRANQESSINMLQQMNPI